MKWNENDNDNDNENENEIRRKERCCNCHEEADICIKKKDLKQKNRG